MVVRELKLDLDAFEGPFDLLLTLVLREELELADVDLASIVVAFVERLFERASRPWPAAAPAGRSPAPPPPDAAEATSPSGAVQSTVPSGAAASAASQEREVHELDLEACGEFLVLIAALLELKARALFPEEEAELAELEPEVAAEELARRLEEYRRMKEAAAWLRERLDVERDRFFRLGPAPLQPQPERKLAPQDPESLATVLRLLAVPPPQVSLNHMAMRFPPVSQFLDRFRAVLRNRRLFDFDTEVKGLTRVEQAIAFLALLELRKAGEVSLTQAAAFAPIRVVRAGEDSATAHERSTAAWNVRSA